MNKPILCVDFDGVIHSYSTPWSNEYTISDGPVPGAIAWLWEATQHFRVMIFSSRSKSKEGRQAMLTWLRLYSEREFGADHPMANGDAPIAFVSEKPAAFLTIDDRCICFDGDWSKVEPKKMLKFKPWNKR